MYLVVKKLKKKKTFTVKDKTLELQQNLVNIHRVMNVKKGTYK